MTDKKQIEVPLRLERRKLTAQEAEHARKVKARNDWLQRGRTGEPPEAIYGGRPPMEKRSEVLERELGTPSVDRDAGGPVGDAPEAAMGGGGGSASGPAKPTDARGRAAVPAPVRATESRTEQFRRASEKKR